MRYILGYHSVNVYELDNINEIWQ